MPSRIREKAEGRDGILIRIGAFLDLDRVQGTVRLKDEVDLVPLLVPVVEYRRRLPRVVPALHDLAHDEGLEEGA